jgi:dihydroflavonol-4-reductase
MTRDADALVTGASGFLGSHLLERLADEDATVTATRHSSPPPDGSEALDGVRWERLDVLDEEAVRAAVDGHDAVYHLAGTGLQSSDERTVRAVNEIGTRNVVEACLDAGVERLVFTSTAGTRRAEGVADERDAAPPVGAYQQSKAAAERIVDAATDRGLDAVTVHPTSIFGPGDESFTARFFALASDPKLFAHPPGGASFVGVADVADGIARAMRRGEPGEHYILGGENLRYREALDAIAEEIGGSAPRITVPAAAIRAAGPVAGVVNRRTGRRFFPFNAEMAELATDTHFYDSSKAAAEIGYDYRPFRETVPPAWSWFRSRTGSSG